MTWVKSLPSICLAQARNRIVFIVIESRELARHTMSVPTIYVKEMHNFYIHQRIIRKTLLMTFKYLTYMPLQWFKLTKQAIKSRTIQKPKENSEALEEIVGAKLNKDSALRIKTKKIFSK